MPFPVKNLIRGRSKPVTVTLENTALEALQEMIRYDFSQLPIVNELGKPEGLITSDSILHSLSNFQVSVNQLHVRDALSTAKAFAPEDDLFELLGSLRDAYAVLIVDNHGVLTGIVTDYDTSEYFRRQAEDMMLVEDIERTLRDFVLASFPNAQESEEQSLDTPELSAAISKLSSSGQDQDRFKKCVAEYLKIEKLNPQLNPASLKAAYEKSSPTVKKAKPFIDLTFFEVEGLFFSDDRWSMYEKCFTMDKAGIRRLLDDIRETRNKLAHFKGEVTEQERKKLRFCLDWLQRHQNAVFSAFPKPATAEVTSLQPVDQPASTLPSPDGVSDVLSEPEQEEPQANDSKYAKLALHLRNLPITIKEQELTFKEIEAAIGSDLPSFARQHRSWWANDAISHVQSQEWLDAGWRVSSINTSDERVKFTRLAGRARAFIDFFSSFVGELRSHPSFQVKEGSPTGDSWHVVKFLPEGKSRKSLLIANFGLHQKFRVELYIDCGDKIKNKLYFDSLHIQKDHIENTFGQPLSWERLDDKKASRVAYYVAGAITDTPEQLEALKKQGAELMVKLLDSLRNPVAEIMGNK